MMVIDCHCHAGQGDGFTGPWDTDAPLGAYLQRAARAGIDAHGAAAGLPFRLRGGQPRAGAHRRASAASAHRLCDGARGARPRSRGADAARGDRTRRPGRHQAASPRRADHARGLRRGARVARAAALRRDRRSLGGRAAGRAVPRRGFHHSAPRQLRRRLARAAGADRPPRAAPERLRRHLRRAPLRPAGPGGAARRRAQDPVRLRRAVAAPGAGAGEGAACCTWRRPTKRWCSAATCCALRRTSSMR